MRKQSLDKSDLRFSCEDYEILEENMEKFEAADDVQEIEEEEEVENSDECSDSEKPATEGA